MKTKIKELPTCKLPSAPLKTIPLLGGKVLFRKLKVVVFFFFLTFVLLRKGNFEGVRKSPSEKLRTNELFAPMRGSCAETLRTPLQGSEGSLGRPIPVGFKHR